MQKNKINNVIVLKELHSNIVEEAIVVLKPHVNLNLEPNTKSEIKKQKFENKNQILKEAQFVLEEYINQEQMEKKQKEKDKIIKKYKILRRTAIVLILLNIFLLIKFF